MGLSATGIHIGTNQRSISFSFQTTSEAECNSVEKALTFIQRYIIPDKGRKSFNIWNIRDNDCAYGLSVSDDEAEKGTVCYVEKQHWGSVVDSYAFDSLRAALTYVQSAVCDTDLVPDEEYLKLVKDEFISE